MSFSSSLYRHLSLVLVGGASLVGCSSFGSTESPSTPDSGAPPSAPSDAGEDDAGLDGGDAGANCPVVLQDNFDASEEITNVWSAQGASRSTVTTESFSAPRSMAADVYQSSPNGYLEAALGLHSRVVATVRVKVVQKGTGEIDLFNLVPEDPSSRPLALIHSKGLAKFAFQAPDSKGSGDSTAPVDLDVVGWHLITIDFDMSTKKVRFEVAGKAVVVGDLPPTWTPGALKLRVGAVYVNEVVSPFLLRFDDVEVRACD